MKYLQDRRGCRSRAPRLTSDLRKTRSLGQGLCLKGPAGFPSGGRGTLLSLQGLGLRACGRSAPFYFLKFGNENQESRGLTTPVLGSRQLDPQQTEPGASPNPAVEATGTHIPVGWVLTVLACCWLAQPFLLPAALEPRAGPAKAGVAQLCHVLPEEPMASAAASLVHLPSTSLRCPQSLVAGHLWRKGDPACCHLLAQPGPCKGCGHPP